MGKVDQAQQDSTIRSVSYGTALRFLRYPFLLLSVTLIPRVMGDSLYGHFALYTSILVMLDVFSDLGYMQIFGRFMPEATASGREDDRTRLFQHTMLFALSISALVFAVFLVFWGLGLTPEIPGSWILLMGLHLMLTQAGGILYILLYGQNRIILFSSREAIKSAATFTFVLFLFSTAGFIGALWGLVLTEAVLVISGAWWARNELKKEWHAWRWSYYRPFLMFGLHFYVPTIFLGLLQRSGNVLTKYMTGSSEQVAYYDIANQFFLIAGSTMSLLITTLVPFLTALFLNNKHEDIDLWHSVVISYGLTLSLLAVNALIWLGEPAVQILLGHDYLPSVSCIVMMSMALAPFLVGQVGVNLSIIYKRPGSYTLAIAAGFAGMLISSWWLVPERGALGASIATLVGYLTYALFFLARYHAAYKPILVRVLKIIPLFLLTPAGLFIPAEGAYKPALFLATSVLLGAVLLGSGIIRYAELLHFVRIIRNK